MQKQYYFAEPCPQCGEEDELDMYKGARKSSTRWWHSYPCCSDECGYAFADNPKLKDMERSVIINEIESLQRQLKVLEVD